MPLEAKRIVAVVSSSAGAALNRLAAEALREIASRRGHLIQLESVDRDRPANPVSSTDVAAADVVILASDQELSEERFTGKLVVRATLAEAIRGTSALVSRATGDEPSRATPGAQSLSLVAVTSCPTGIAHTFMAADGLQRAAASLGIAIKVETLGSIGAKNLLTPEEIGAAAAVIIAADTTVDTSRFNGKRLLIASTNEAIRAGPKLIAAALALPEPPREAKPQGVRSGLRPTARGGAYKHLMTGVSNMLPVVVAGGLAIALAFAVGGIYAARETGTLGAALSQIGGAAFGLIVAILAGYIAFSIAERPGLAPGLIGGMLAQQLGAGFLGGIAAGFLAGYLTRSLNRWIKLPVRLEGLKPVLILPFIASLGIGLLMIYVVAPPMHAALAVSTSWLNHLQGSNALVLGCILGAMMAFDMGGPINKAAYTFSVGLLASQVSSPMAAVMAAGMTPPLGLAIASFLFPSRFEREENEARGAALVLGLAFITEGAIPFAAKDPFRVIPALMAGSALAGALSMYAGVHLLVPHGGIFAALIPGAVSRLAVYVVAIAAGSSVTAGLLRISKRQRIL